MGDALKIRVSSHRERPVAAILTLSHNDSMVYKYGASDVSAMNLGGMHALLWKAIQESREAGLRRFDFGRSDADDHGLIQFKDRWGAVKSELTYLRHPLRGAARSSSSLVARVARQLARRAPQPLLHLAGRALYGHWAALVLSMGATVTDAI
jgi:CelD/BcsL family acetyltransferase involved in cellulose biosynthesis